MMDVDTPQFSCPQQEIDYWKERANAYFTEKLEIQKELEEFTEESKQLEKELEANYEQAERAAKEFEVKFNRAQNECESLQHKIDQSNTEMTEMQVELSRLKNERTSLQSYVRELEQKNDDLERHNREVMETVSYLQSTVNQHIEQSALLDSELDEKESLKVKYQRLLDESKDLRQELKLKDTRFDVEKIPNGHTPTVPIIDSNRLQMDSETQTTPQKRDSGLNGEVPQSPQNRVIALNLVGDIMKKIGLSRYVCDKCGGIKCTECPTSPYYLSKPAKSETGPNKFQFSSTFLQNIELRLIQLRQMNNAAENNRNRRLSRGNQSPTIQNSN